MSTKTTNLELTKDSSNEFYDIEKVNVNLDLIDAAVGNKVDKVDYVRTPAFGNAGGAVNAYTFNGMIATELVDGMSVYLNNEVAKNTGPSTLNWSGLGAKQITDAKGVALAVGKMPLNCIVGLRYNASTASFQLLGEGGEYGTAIASQVLTGNTLGTVNGVIPGTMPNNGSVGTQNLTVEGAEYTIPVGYHNGLGKVKAVITGILASVIKAGTTVGGILGTFTSDATATAGNLLSGVTAYVNGVKITGTIPSKAAATITPSTVNQTISANQYLSGIQTISAVVVPSAKVLNDTTIAGTTGTIPSKAATTITPSTVNQVIAAEQYLSGTQTIAGDADLIPANIRLDKNIFNVQGSNPYYVGATVNYKQLGLSNPPIKDLLYVAGGKQFIGVNGTDQAFFCYVSGSTLYVARLNTTTGQVISTYGDTVSNLNAETVKMTSNMSAAGYMKISAYSNSIGYQVWTLNSVGGLVSKVAGGPYSSYYLNTTLLDPDGYSYDFDVNQRSLIKYNQTAQGSIWAIYCDAGYDYFGGIVIVGSYIYTMALHNTNLIMKVEKRIVSTGAISTFKTHSIVGGQALPKPLVSDGVYIYAVTNTTLYRYNLECTLIDSYAIPNIKDACVFNNKLYLLQFEAQMSMVREKVLTYAISGSLTLLDSFSTPYLGVNNSFISMGLNNNLIVTGGVINNYYNYSIVYNVQENMTIGV